MCFDGFSPAGKDGPVPLVRIDVTGPQTLDHVRAVLRGTREAITETLGVPDDRVHLRLIETPAAHIDAPPCRTSHFTLVDIILYEGRTPELKAACISAIRRKLGDDPGIPASEIAVAFRDMSTTDLDVLPGQAGS